MSSAVENGRRGAAIAQGEGRKSCWVCGKALDGNKKRYCGKAHQQKANRMRRLDLAETIFGYNDGTPLELVDRGLIERDDMIVLICEELDWSQHQAGVEFDLSQAQISRILHNHRRSVEKREKRADWSPPGRAFPDVHWDLTVAHIPALIADFLDFRGRWFKTPQGKPYQTPGFQRRWVEAILKALVTGGRQVILSPPRHGKTELLIHVACWLICRFPNIRILWVGGNEKIAQRSVRLVARKLAGDSSLIETYVGPGGKFKPHSGSGLTWSASEFTVANRTHPDIKGATMTALGRGGTLLSLDADIIVADDIEDHQSTAQPGSREATRDWWTSDLESRKEDHTGLFVIGSRQHIDDLVGHLEENPEYETISETAHDPECELPETDVDAHVDCMLFPELRSYAFLQKQKRASEGSGGLARFNMVWLGIVSGKGMTIFVASEIAACRDSKHVVGNIPSPIESPGVDPEDIGGINLVGGLDPSGSGYQAAFLWAYQTRPELRMWMVDTENQEGGGIDRARTTIWEWFQKYRLRHWVVEENLYHGGIVSDDVIRTMRENHQIIVEPHRTDVNKWDPYLGVSTLKPEFAERRIVLPYGNPESIAKSDQYQRQLVHFSDAPRNRNARAGYKSDLVMASWFPMGVIRRAINEFISEMGVDYEPEYADFVANDWNTAPWDTSWVA